MDVVITGTQVEIRTSAVGGGSIGALTVGGGISNSFYATSSSGNGLISENYMVTGLTQAVVRQLNLTKGADWRSLLFYLYDRDDSTYWGTLLLDASAYLDGRTEVKLLFLYRDFDLINNSQSAGQNWIILRIGSDEETNYLMRSNGTGSTELLSNRLTVNTNVVFTPSNLDYSLELPEELVLVNNQAGQTWSVAENDKVVINNSAPVPHHLALTGYSLTKAPDDIEGVTFLESVAQFEPNGGDKQIFLNLNIKRLSGENNLILLTLLDHPSVPASELDDDFIMLAVLQGQPTSEMAEVGLNIVGKYNNTLVLKSSAQNMSVSHKPDMRP